MPSVTRRRFIGGSVIPVTFGALGGLGSTACERPKPAALPVAPRPAGTLEDVLAQAIDSARKAGASYADARIVRRRTERIATREDHVV